MIVPTSRLWPHGAPTWSPLPDQNGHYTIVYADRASGQTPSDLFASSATCGAPNRVQLTDTPTSVEAWPSWSPDGSLLAACVAPVQSDCDIHTFDVVSGTSGGLALAFRANLTAGGPLANNVYGPSWTADGTELLVSGASDLRMISALTPGVATRLTDTPGVLERRPTWSPDRTRIAFDAEGNLYTADISRDTSQAWTLSEAVLLRDFRNSAGHPSWRTVQ